MVRIGNDWDELLKDEFETPRYLALRQFLIQEYRTATVYPAAADLFNALKATPYQCVRAVILGQDPYHGPSQAHGMCFSVQRGVRTPPSLVNIYKELNLEFGYPIPDHGNLEAWAKEGVLLLNTILSVRAGSPMSHVGKGWEDLTDAIILKLAQRETPMVFLLWGAAAGKKAPLIEGHGHLILRTVHPSPLSAHRGFLGCDHFKKANAFLKAHGQGEINWQIV
ncbi:Uracil-DNA glycosylase, family 1 [Clostridiaceae bacterium JG1575]|nr:Uracil-DNA glycosylase, family 1 [Clostridiaceae bacterium JG1575]